MLTPFRIHILRWEEGCGSSECTKTRPVFSRGQLPCDILFIGESPGESEVVMRQPFRGAAGHLLDTIINKAVKGRTWCPICRRGNIFQLQREDGDAGLVCDNGHDDSEGSAEIRMGFTNLVCCMPKDENGKKVEPYPEQVESCMPRLQEFIRIANPSLIVCVGSHARDWLDTKYVRGVKLHKEIPMVHILHPSAILQTKRAFQQQKLLDCVHELDHAIIGMCV